MELRTLHYFLTVAREENITRAAEALHLTQPTLSRQLMQLEEEIGTELLIRGKRKIELTDAGRLLRRRAEEILTLVDKTEKELMNDDENMIGELVIGTAESLSTHTFLPKLIESFSYMYPQVTYDLYTGNADLVKERLDQGSIDIGVLLEPVDIEKYDFIRLPSKERWGIVVNVHDPLSKKEYITPKDLMNVPLMMTNRPLVQNEIASWFQDIYDQIDIKVTFNLLSNAVSLVKNGLGIVMTIEGSFCHYSTDDVKFIPLYPELSTSSVIVWKKHQVLSPITKQFITSVYHALSE